MMRPHESSAGSAPEWLARARGSLSLAKVVMPKGGYYEDLCFQALGSERRRVGWSPGATPNTVGSGGSFWLATRTRSCFSARAPEATPGETSTRIFSSSSRATCPAFGARPAIAMRSESSARPKTSSSGPPKKWLTGATCPTRSSPMLRAKPECSNPGRTRVGRGQGGGPEA